MSKTVDIDFFKSTAKSLNPRKAELDLLSLEDDPMNRTIVIKSKNTILPQNFSWQDWWEQKIKINFLFFKAIEEDDLRKAKNLLDKRKYKEQCADINACQPEELGGNSALHVASLLGRVDIVQLIISDPGADINVRNETFKAPVHLAAENGHPQVLKLLAGCLNVVFDLEDMNRDTPLHRAASEGHIDCVVFILTQKTCNPDKLNRYN